MAEKIKLGSNGNFGVKEGGTLAYNDENNVFKAIELASSRASGATYVAESGLIADAEVGVPRIDWTNGVGELLLEPQSTNLIKQSNDFSGWSLTGGSITSTNNLSPDGNNNATLITPSSTDCFLRELTNSFTSGQDYTASIYLKSNTGSSFNVDLRLRENSGGQDLIESKLVTTEWQRFDITISASLTSTYTFWIGGSSTWQTGEDLLIFGAQVEELSYPTSYIRTSGSAETRIADAVTGNESLGQVINSSEGVLYFEGSSTEDSFKTLSISDGSSNNRVVIARSSTVIRALIVSGGTVNTAIDSTQDDGNHKVAIVYNGSNFSLYIDGSLIGTQSMTSFSVDLDSFSLSQFFGSGNEFYGRVREVKVYDTALTDAELTALTTL